MPKGKKNRNTSVFFMPFYHYCPVKSGIILLRFVILLKMNAFYSIFQKLAHAISGNNEF
jgi:hypothetical protein